LKVGYTEYKLGIHFTQEFWRGCSKNWGEAWAP